MKSRGLWVVVLLATPAFAGQEHPSPELPAAVGDLVVARPFKLAKGYKYDWSREPRTVTSGVLVVLKVDPSLVVPRNSAEPVLYAGDQPVQRLNHGHESGHVIGIIPGKIDLSSAPIWFGRPELPERVDAKMVRAERALAEKAKIQPFPENKVRAAMQERIEAADLAALLREHVAELVLEFSPQEKQLAETWRLPVAKPSPKSR